jgi:hypothetical protein
MSNDARMAVCTRTFPMIEVTGSKSEGGTHPEEMLSSSPGPPLGCHDLFAAALWREPLGRRQTSGLGGRMSYENTSAADKHALNEFFS